MDGVLRKKKKKDCRKKAKRNTYVQQSKKAVFILDFLGDIASDRAMDRPRDDASSSWVSRRLGVWMMTPG